MRISDWSSDVCSSDLSSPARRRRRGLRGGEGRGEACASVAPCGEQHAEAGEHDNSDDEQHNETRDRLLAARSEEHTSELQSLMRISYAVFCLKKKKKKYQRIVTNNITQQ